MRIRREVAVALRRARGYRFWHVVLGERCHGEFVDQLPENADATLYIAHADADGSTAARTSGPGFQWCNGEELRSLAAAGELAAEDADAVCRWETEDCLRGIGESPDRAKAGQA